MGIEVCPNCQNRYVIDEFNTDYLHRCNSTNSTLDEEDAFLIGTFQNDNELVATGTNPVNPENVAIRKINLLEGTRAGIEGERLDRFTVRGNPATTHRQKQHWEYISRRKE